MATFEEALATLNAIKAQLQESTGTINTALQGLAGDIQHLTELLQQGGGLTPEQQAALDEVVSGLNEVKDAIGTAAQSLAALDAQTPPPAPPPAP